MPTKYTNTNSVPIKKEFYNRNKIRKVYKKRTYYLFLTLVLIICLLQTSRGVYLNVAKYIVLNKQLNKLENLNTATNEKNTELKSMLKNYTSSRGIEALARDNLKMVGKDEVLVVIEPPVVKKTEKR